MQVTGSGISCPGDCAESYFAGTSVKLTANQPNAVFSGGCSGTGSCTVLMDHDKTVFVGAGEAFIRVDNVDQCGGDCGQDLDILIDGVLVADDLSLSDSPVTKKVSPGSHTVRAFCGTPNESQELQSQTPNVAPGQTANVNFNSGQCD